MDCSIKEILDYIASSVPVEVYGKQNLTINRAASLLKAGPSSLTWIKPGITGVAKLAESKKGVLFICDQDIFRYLGSFTGDNCFLVTADPKCLFSKIAAHFFYTKPSYGVHPTAFIHPEAAIGNNCTIGPFSYIGKTNIGDNVIIHGNCFIYDDVKIGDNVEVHAGTVIGSDGFGYSKSEAGEPQKFPHLGGVIIEDDVEIGANTCIDRGALDDTIIRRGAKIDNLVHIAHNVVIGENAFIIAHAMIGGSVEIAKGAWIAPSVSILQQLKIGEKALIAMGAVVLRDVPASETWAGVPAKKINDNL